MSLVVLENASLAFGDRPILERASLRIADGDRIGLIGPNGSGKSTLLRILAGRTEIDGGSIERRRATRAGYLTQDIDHTSGTSALELCLSSVADRATIDSDLAHAQSMLAAAADRGDDDECIRLSADVAELSERLALIERDFGDHEALRILAGLGFSTADANRDLGELSGGWQMRAHLAALLFQKPDLLLLDEPTNHLDMPSVAWFTDFLRTCKSAYVLVSHDREFLNDHIDQIVSFEPEGLKTYPGNLDRYERQRAEEAAILEARAQNLARERERMQRFVDRFRAQANKAAAVQSRVKALAKMEDIDKLTAHKRIHLTFASAGRPVAEIARAEGIAKAFEKKKVFHGVDLVVRRGEKIAILGPNGAGKTTLLKIIAGELAPDRGTVKVGRDIAMGYYAQHHADTLTPDATVYSAVMDHCPDATPGRVRSILGALLFHGDDIDKPIKVLSGGERARVALARLIVAPSSFLVMDEPTNHLDLASADSLGASLSEWDGTLLFVSHNLALVRKVATQIWSLDDGALEIYGGSLDDYLYSRRLRAADEPAASHAEARKPAPAPAKREDDRARKRREAERRNHKARRLRPIQKRIADIEARIAKLEGEQKALSQKLSDPDIYDDAAQRSTLFGDYQKTTEKLSELFARWEAASEELATAEAELSEA